MQLSSPPLQSITAPAYPIPPCCEEGHTRVRGGQRESGVLAYTHFNIHAHNHTQHTHTTTTTQPPTHPRTSTHATHSHTPNRPESGVHLQRIEARVKLGEAGVEGPEQGHCHLEGTPRGGGRHGGAADAQRAQLWAARRHTCRQYTTGRYSYTYNHTCRQTTLTETGAQRIHAQTQTTRHAMAHKNMRMCAHLGLQDIDLLAALVQLHRNCDRYTNTHTITQNDNK